ncbi:MAG: IPT/TIG domain-containing protein [Thermotaleaceae bacterium]
MKKKCAAVLAFVMLLNIFTGVFFIEDVYADDTPSIDKVEIEEMVEVVNGQRTTKYQVKFNGYPMTNIEAIRIMKEGITQKTLPKERLQQIDSANIVYIPSESEQTINSIFGTTGKVAFTIVRKDGSYPGNKEFQLPATEDNFMKIDTINGLSLASWPVTVIKGNPFTLEGIHFNREAYRMYITPQGNPMTTEINYSVDNNTKISVGTDTINIAAGNNQNLIFERSSGDNIKIKYIIKNAINVANPLDLGEVFISPLQGTEGTILRIKAEKPVPLLDIGTKIYIGGVEAKRNVSTFSDGTFTYMDNGVRKQGLEIIVPRLATAGPKPIIFKNFDNDTYRHEKDFTYSLAAGSVLEIISTDGNHAYTNEEKAVNLRVRNAVNVNNIEAVKDRVGIIPQEAKAEDLTFFKEIDPKAYYIKYDLGDGTYIERKITVSIGLKAKVNGFSAESGDVASLSATTDKVSQAGDYVISARTETVYYSMDGGAITELDYIVEEAPFGNQPKINFKFESDIYTPVISRITPELGPHDQYIAATLIGDKFRVETVGGVTTFPTIVIGSQSLTGAYKYKVIQKTIENGIERNRFYYSNTNNGTVDPALEIPRSPEDPITSMVVLDSAGNEIDGQRQRSGTQIKFTIPKGESGVIGFADITVYNPSPLNGLGGKDTKENIFKYVAPASGALLPRIDSVNPDKVAVGKRQEVTIKGRNFHRDLILTVDGEVIPDRKVDIVNGTIVFNAPTGRQGATYLQVINPDGGFASSIFEYIQAYSQPIIEKIIPNFGGKGNLIIIKGRNFYRANPEGENENIKIGLKVYIDGKDINRVYYNELRNFINEFDENNPIYGPNGEPLQSYGSNVAVVDDKTIYLILPDPKIPEKSFFLNEWLDIKVVNPDLGYDELKKGFKFLNIVENPRLDSVKPGLGDYRGGNIVEITGSNLQEGVKVYFGSQEAQVYRRSNNGRNLWVYVPAYGGDLKDSNQAVVPVTVLNTNGSSHTKYDGYTYVNPGYTPTITGIDKKEGDTAGGTRVLISGTDFRAYNLGKADQKLPDIYFGGVKVESKDITFKIDPQSSYKEVESSTLLIVENTPPHSAGKVDLTIINYDGGTVTAKNIFEYKSKQVSITQVLPDGGTKYGGTEITIYGKDFVERGLHVAFGDQTVQGDILSGTRRIRIGDIIVDYNAYAANNINLYYKNVEEGNKLEGYKVYPQKSTEKSSSFKIIEEEEYMIVTLPWSEVYQKFQDEAIANWADENIKIEIKDQNLIVTRRLGIVKSIEEDRTKLVVLSPPSGEVGQKDLIVYSDGKSAKSKFTYTNPYRSPVITKVIPATAVTTADITGENLDIDLTTAAPKGGSPLIIQGQNFRSGVTVYIGNKQATIKSKSPNDDELVVVVPEAAEGTVGSYLRILVVNEDRGEAYGDHTNGGTRKPIYFRYIVEGSSPKITSVTPNTGPVTGGTEVIIKGTDFKDQDTFEHPKTVEVYIGGIPVAAGDVRVEDIETVVVTMPEGRVGKQTIEIVNYDFGRALAQDIFTYISQPQILSVAPTKIFTNDTNTEVTISGKMFQSGAKVVIGGKIIDESAIKAGMVVNGTGILGVVGKKNRAVAVVDGKVAASVTVDSELTLRVKFNEAIDLSNSHIIIINPDGGVSKEYRDFEYQIPVPNKPLVLEAIPGFESTVQLLWSQSSPEVLNAAESYEVYGKRADEKQYTLLGNTQNPSFIVKGLEPNTRYSFMVRALNKYGSAVEFAEATVRTFSISEDDKLREKQEQLDKEKTKLEEEGKEEVSNGILIKTLGTKQVTGSSGALTIDFSLSKYKNYNNFIVAIPLPLAQSSGRQIIITDGKVNFGFTPKDLYTREASQVASKDLGDAYVRVSFERLGGKTEETLKTAVARTQRQASQIYEIGFELQVGKNLSSIRRMLGNGSLEIKFDAAAYAGANKDKLFVAEYDPSQDKFIKLGNGNRAYPQAAGKYVLLSDR